MMHAYSRIFCFAIFILVIADISDLTPNHSKWCFVVTWFNSITCCNFTFDICGYNWQKRQVERWLCPNCKSIRVLLCTWSLLDNNLLWTSGAMFHLYCLSVLLRCWLKLTLTILLIFQIILLKIFPLHCAISLTWSHFAWITIMWSR